MEAIDFMHELILIIDELLKGEAELKIEVVTGARAYNLAKAVEA